MKLRHSRRTVKLWGYRVNDGCETVPSQHDHCSQGSSLVQSFMDTHRRDECLSIGKEKRNSCPSCFLSHSSLEQESSGFKCAGVINQGWNDAVYISLCLAFSIKLQKSHTKNKNSQWICHILLGCEGYSLPSSKCAISFHEALFILEAQFFFLLLLFIWARFYLWINCKCVYSKITTLVRGAHPDSMLGTAVHAPNEGRKHSNAAWVWTQNEKHLVIVTHMHYQAL